MTLEIHIMHTCYRLFPVQKGDASDYHIENIFYHGIRSKEKCYLGIMNLHILTDLIKLLFFRFLFLFKNVSSTCHTKYESKI